MLSYSFEAKKQHQNFVSYPPPAEPLWICHPGRGEEHQKRFTLTNLLYCVMHFAHWELLQTITCVKMEGKQITDAGTL